MRCVTVGGVAIHCASEGADDGPALVFSNSLGTDFRIWDPMLPLLPSGLRIIRYDKRGHGLSDLPTQPWGMDHHINDLIGVMEAFGVLNAMVCGLSVGGLIAQGLAARRPDLIRAMVLMDTAAKIGDAEMWNARISAVEAGGIEAMSDAILQRWFTARFRHAAPDFPLWRNMLCRTTQGGYAGTCRAIRDTDFTRATGALTLPTLAMAGAEDGSTPPDLVRDTAALIPGAAFHVIDDAGHLPNIEQPQIVADLLTGFLRETGHL